MDQSYPNQRIKLRKTRAALIYLSCIFQVQNPILFLFHSVMLIHQSLIQMEMEQLLSIKPKTSFSSKISPNPQLAVRWYCSQKTSSLALSVQHSLAKRGVFRTCSVNPKQSITSIASIVLFIEDAYAADSMSSETMQTASKSPEWLGPAVLAFPVVSYLLFNIYRDKVNPDAKVSDWMYGLAAMVIVANLVTIATLGIRLY